MVSLVMPRVLAAPVKRLASRMARLGAPTEMPRVVAVCGRRTTVLVTPPLFATVASVVDPSARVVGAVVSSVDPSVAATCAVRLADVIDGRPAEYSANT